MMLRLHPGLTDGTPLKVLCIGAHSDDLEIGCAGTILTWIGSFSRLEVTWVVLSGGSERAREAKLSARALLRGSTSSRVVLGKFRDGFFPAQYAELKSYFESLKGGFPPDIIFTHRLTDRHQDHRLSAELTWNTWRDHLILEYEVPKYEGDLSQPNAYQPISKALALRKGRHLERYFATQRSKDWFVQDNFISLMRLRGMECRSSSGFAEAFHVSKFVM